MLPLVIVIRHWKFKSNCDSNLWAITDSLNLAFYEFYCQNIKTNNFVFATKIYNELMCFKLKFKDDKYFQNQRDLLIFLSNLLIRDIKMNILLFIKVSIFLSL